MRRPSGPDGFGQQHCERCGYQPEENFKHKRSRFCLLHSKRLEQQLAREVVIVGEDDPATAKAFDRLSANREAAGR